MHSDRNATKLKLRENAFKEFTHSETETNPQRLQNKHSAILTAESSLRKSDLETHKLKSK